MDENMPVERIFNLSGVGGNNRMSDDELMDYEASIHARINDAVDFEESYLSRFREENQAYYYGLKPSIYDDDAKDGTYVDQADKPNKSSFISTDVRDTIMAIIPSLVRIFTASEEKIMSFTPHREEDQEIADLMYDYANHVFYNENEGFLMLYGVLKDALTVKGAATTWWTDTDFEIKEQTFQNITIEQYQVLVEEAPDIEIVELEMDEGSQYIDSLTVRYAESKPMHRVCSIPPDELRIDREAKSAKDNHLIGWERVATVSDLVKKGYDPEELKDFISTRVVLSDERYMRNPGLVDDNPFNDGILYGDWFIRVDGDGDGIDELRHICTIGTGRFIIHDEAVSEPNIALWQSDPRPHTAIGDCPADQVSDVQDVKSQLIRGMLDSLADTINPRMVVNELVTNIEDALNEDIGAVIRVRGNPRDSVDFLKQPFAGGEIQPNIDYMDNVRASRTGITEASKGLDPAAMQSTNLVGINAIVTGAQERIELIARLLAETGLKPTFLGIIREAINNPNALRQIKLRGKHVNVDPSLFDPSFRLEVNPTMGKGSDITRLQALMDVRNTQKEIIAQFGIANPIVTPAEFMNTVTDMLSLVNVKNVGRYFKPITPELLESISSQPKEPDPATLLAQAELEKVKKDMLIATDKSERDDQKLVLQAKKEQEEMDFKRDKLSIDSAIRVFDIAMDPKPQTVTEGAPEMIPSVENRNQSG